MFYIFCFISNKPHYKLREIEIIVYIETSFTIKFGGPWWSETIEISGVLPQSNTCDPSSPLQAIP